MSWREWITATAITAMVAFPQVAKARNKRIQLEGERLIQRARKLSDIRAKGGLPFHLGARFRFKKSSESPVEGTYTLDWVSPTQWSQQLKTTGFREIEVGGTGTIWILRSTQYEPLVAYSVKKALGFYRELTLPSRGAVKSLRRVDAGKMIRLKTRFNTWTGYRLWIDANSGILVRKEGPANLREVLSLRDYHTLGPRFLFPWQISESEEGVFTLRIGLDSLSQLHEIAPALFDPPLGAKERPGCQDPEPPVPITLKVPHYPKRARKRYTQGIVSLSLSIGANGSVKDVTILNTPSPDLASASMTTIKKEWRFKPAMCGKLSVPTDSLVQTSFSLLP